MPDKHFSERRSGLRASQRIAEAILDYVGQIPVSAEHRHAKRQAAPARSSARLPARRP
jgi:hypothetical protein